jgi:Cytotoxic
MSDAGTKRGVDSVTRNPEPTGPEGAEGLSRSRAKRKTSRPGGGLRARWKDDDGTIYERDYLHGKVEKHDHLGRHLGEFDPETGEQTTPRTNREVEP